MVEMDSQDVQQDQLKSIINHLEQENDADKW